MLREVWLKIRETAADPEGDLRAALDEMDVAAIHAAADTIGEIAREPDEDFQNKLMDRYVSVRRFLTKLLKTIDFHAGAADTCGKGSKRGFELLKGIDFLKSLERRKSPDLPEEVPKAFLTSAWHRRVFPKKGENAGGFDKLAYTIATVERLRDSLRRHEVFVPGLNKWGDPTAGLLSGEAWEKARTKICRDLNLSAEPGQPSGWPSAMAPPSGLTWSGSMRRSWRQARAWAANASLISAVSRSSIAPPAWVNALRVAGIGPRPMTSGCTPAVAPAT